MTNFFPTLRYISDITRAQYAVITFTEDHQFLVNEIIGLRVSKPYGMVEINNREAKVLAITSNTVTVNVDSTEFSNFTVPVDTRGTTPPCAVPSSSGVDFTSPIPRTILEDAFDNRPE
jgi:hypothetical protein